jgi:hypothetical protein
MMVGYLTAGRHAKKADCVPWPSKTGDFSIAVPCALTGDHTRLSGLALAVEELLVAERNRHADGQDRFDALRRFREGTAS